jgi:hypothetical protein
LVLTVHIPPTVSPKSVYLDLAERLLVSVKNQYVQAGGELGIAAPSYTATYTFTAQTIGVNDTFTLQGSSQFTITDFNNCS